MKLVSWASGKIALFFGMALLVLFSHVLPANAAPAQYPTGYQNYNFYIYHDGNNNGYLDYFGSDTCYRGNRDMGLYRTVNGSTSTVHIVDIPTGSDYTVNDFSTYWSCLHSSPTYSIVAPTTGNQFSLGKQLSFHFFNSYYTSDPDVSYSEGLKWTD